MNICPECKALASSNNHHCPNCDSKMNNLGKISKKNLSQLVSAWVSQGNVYFENKDFYLEN